MDLLRLLFNAIVLEQKLPKELRKNLPVLDRKRYVASLFSI